MGGGAEHVVHRAFGFPRHVHSLQNKVFRRLSRQTLGRPSRKMWMCQPTVEEWFDATPLDTVLSSLILLFPAVGPSAHESVQEQVARTCLETDHSLWPATGGKENYSGNATQVDKQAGFSGIAEEHPIGKRGQRQSLAADCDIARAEIADDRQPGALRDHCGHPYGKS
jgi:hypothetical protein